MISPDVFASVVAGHLEPAMQGCGLHPLPSESSYSARFGSSSAEVRVDYDAAGRRELHVWLRQVGGEGGELALDSLEPVWKVPIVSDPDVLGRILDRLATFLITHHRALLAGDPFAFADVHHQVIEKSHEHCEHAMNEPLIAQADQAWSRRDLHRVAELLLPIEGWLDPLHRRRLDYARSQIDRPGRQ